MWFRRKVQKGHQLGRKIGFPTVNLNVGTFGDYVQKGVYHAQVKVGSKIYQGALYFGPRLSKAQEILEIYILDFDEMIYGQWVTFQIIKKIRKPMKFTDLNELKKQIEKDIRP